VKVSVRFRGRQITHTEIGKRVLERIIADVGDLAVVEKKPNMEGRNMMTILAPKNH